MVRNVPRQRLIFVLVAALMGAPTESRGIEIAIEFTGTVSAQFDPFWQRLLPELAPVSGRFVFDSNSIGTHSTAGCDCMGYAQHVVNGFSADIGDISVRADQYVVEVSNDIDQGDGVFLDFLTVRWDSELTPALTSPLLVNDTVATTGLFSASLGGGPDVFSSSALPSQASLDEYFFPSAFNALGDYDPLPGSVDVLFEVSAANPTSFRSGDFDFDEDVDGSDFLKWQRTFHDPAGLAAWRGDFSAGVVERSMQAAAPELNAFSLATIAIVAAGRYVRAARARFRCGARES
jgi:hypothetical protein